MLVQLVKLTPIGYRKLRDSDPERALALLTEGDELVDNLTAAGERRRKTGRRSSGGFDDLKPIDPAEALRHRTPG